MDRTIGAAEKPAKSSSASADSSAFVPREQSPQQAAQDPPAPTKRLPGQQGLTPLAKLIKELGHETDPDLRDASKARKKSLKAVLTCLQDPKSSREEQQALLIKALLAQASEGRRLEQLVIPLRQKHDAAVRSNGSTELELARKTALNQTLQDLCRSLQSSNGLLKEQLEKRGSLQEAGQQQAEAFQEALASITARLETEKEKFAHLQEASEQNDQLKRQVVVLERQIEVQQQLCDHQDLQLKTLQEMLEKQQQEEKSREEVGTRVIADLRTQNEGLHQQILRQEELLTAQQKQFEDCRKSILEATEGMGSYIQILRGKQLEIDTISAEHKALQKHFKLLEAEIGPDILEGFRRVKAHKSALESLCRALQDENRRLQVANKPLSETQQALENEATPRDEEDPEQRASEASRLGDASVKSEVYDQPQCPKEQPCFNEQLPKAAVSEANRTDPIASESAHQEALQL